MEYIGGVLFQITVLSLGMSTVDRYLGSQNLVNFGQRSFLKTPSWSFKNKSSMYAKQDNFGIIFRFFRNLATGNYFKKPSHCANTMSTYHAEV